MRKVTSADMINAIDFAKAQQEINKELARRDKDENLDCIRILCSVISPVDAANKEFEVIFNYGDIDDKPRKGEDIHVRILYKDNTPSNWTWKSK